MIATVIPASAGDCFKEGGRRKPAAFLQLEDRPLILRLMESTPPKPTREGWEAVRCTSLDDMRTQNVRFWQRAGGAAIRQAAWDLVVETWMAHGRDPDELRFQRLAPAFRRS